MNGADVCHAVLSDQDLPGGKDRPGDGLQGDDFSFDCMGLR